MTNPEIINKRKAIALNKIKSAYGTDEDEYGGIETFISHHIEEIEPEYWIKHLGKANPEPQQVVSLLQFIHCWDDDLAYDFSLPDEATNYVICVRFDNEENIIELVMES